MSKLSLLEIAQSQLDKTPVIDGQLIVCLDTGNAYRDTATAHVKIGSDLEVVSDLPLAPLAEKIYYLKPDKLYAYLGGNWTLLNDKTIDLDESIAKLPAGSSTSLNDDVEIITQDTDITQPHYYRRKLVVIWEYIKTKAQDFFAAKNHKHGKADITDFPTSMPASDVYPWAKAATKPSYTKAEVGLGNVDNTADANKSVKYATSAGNASKVNNHTVNIDVPANAKFTDTTYGVATASSNGLMSSTDKTKLDDFSRVISIQKQIKLTTDWQDTGIAGNNLETGTYVVQVSGFNSSYTSLYSEIYSGIMTWYASETNNLNNDEIFLHNAGHASNSNDIYLRTSRRLHGNGGLHLQIACKVAATGTDTLTFKFRRLI